ncbi:ferric reductase-like transmembrane domain-containing protein [bacterium]|nr:ferric reductase-like transmembrane domain-containing protein [bacterium]
MDNIKNNRVIWAAIARIILYIIVVITPLVLAAVLRPQSIDNFTCELSRNFALLAFSILAMQFVVSARFKWLERPFGLDVIFRFHKAMGVFSATLLILHPILLAAGKSWYILLNTTWYILMAEVGLLILLILVFISIFRLAIRLEYEKWRFLHNIMASLILLIGFLHSWNVGSDLRGDLIIYRSQIPMRFLWVGMLGVAVLAYVYHRALRPLWHRRRAYRVIEVMNETHDVWTIKFAPPEGEKCYDYLPGQCHFIKLYRGSNLPVEEHPFTISSSPTDEGFVSSTIKESGDFTATIGQTKPGDAVSVQGPYGRFSYVCHPDERELVFIAGGVGITPLMSMLRHIRDARADKDILLLYGNRTEKDIIFRDELSAMESGEHPRLKVVYILSQAGEDWKGETGYIDQEKLERLCNGRMANKAFYVCGPPVLMENVLRALRVLGVQEEYVHYERFSL